MVWYKVRGNLDNLKIWVSKKFINWTVWRPNSPAFATQQHLPYNTSQKPPIDSQKLKIIQSSKTQFILATAVYRVTPMAATPTAWGLSPALPSLSSPITNSHKPIKALLHPNFFRPFSSSKTNPVVGLSTSLTQVQNPLWWVSLSGFLSIFLLSSTIKLLCQS